MTTRIRIFSNGSQYMDWQASNCERCKKAIWTFEPPTCPIQVALEEADFDDGTISEEIAKQSGYDKERYVWPCAEVEWTEEWKAECKEQHP